MNANIAALLYLLSGVLFILALRGLSSPESSRTGNRNGMIGMAIAVVTTLLVAGITDPLTWALIIGGFGIGGGIGAVTARRIAMTAMPQLVAAFHSLVGLAARNQCGGDNDVLLLDRLGDQLGLLRLIFFGHFLGVSARGLRLLELFVHHGNECSA